MISSARARSNRGTVRPSALAVFKASARGGGWPNRIEARRHLGRCDRECRFLAIGAEAMLVDGGDDGLLSRHFLPASARVAPA
jgi:hypothetical protein